MVAPHGLRFARTSRRCAPPQRGSAPMALLTMFVAVTPKPRGRTPRTPLVLVHAIDLIAPHGLEPW